MIFKRFYEGWWGGWRNDSFDTPQMFWGWEILLDNPRQYRFYA